MPIHWTPIERQRAAVRAAEAQRAEALQAREAARQRAHELLLSHLTKAQRATMKQHGWFVVEGGQSKNKYRIQVGIVAGNIEQIDGPKYRYCCHVNHDYPPADNALAQKLMLEHAEGEFLRLANRA